ncbi:GPP34 family phosphoprotein [Streptomyces roseoverticillatus]|uniref:GOLPH3/VPS74 family protein n=1 Tax=Streptomyces roseoverticillatus TaxID=66429 RepID=UPI0033FAE855
MDRATHSWTHLLFDNKHDEGNTLPSLPEELLLLALDDESGSVYADAIGLGLAGAQLVELTLGGHVVLEDGRLHASAGDHTDDPLLDAALADIAASGKPTKPSAWLSSRSKSMVGVYGARLAEAGLVKHQKGRALGVITTHRYPAADTSVKAGVRARLDAVVAKRLVLDPRTQALASLVHAIGLARRLYSGREGAGARKELRALAEGDWAARAVSQEIAKATAAITAAVAAAAVAAVAGSS